MQLGRQKIPRTFPEREAGGVPQCLQLFARSRTSRSAFSMVYQDPLLAYLPDGKVRRRRKKRADLNEDFSVTDPETWHKQYQVYQDWRDTSPTLQCLKDNAVRFQQTCDAVKRGLQQAQSQIVDQVDSSRDAVVVALKQQLKSARAKLRRALQQQQQQQKASEDLGADLMAFSKYVSGSEHDSQNFAIGSLVFGALAFVCGSAPWLLPYLYLVFAAVALPWRVYQFYRKRLTFFLLDFCYVSAAMKAKHAMYAAIGYLQHPAQLHHFAHYSTVFTATSTPAATCSMPKCECSIAMQWANLAVMWYLVFGSSNPHLGTMVYTLADGPLAGALLVWQSAWVFGSAAHFVR